MTFVLNIIKALAQRRFSDSKLSGTPRNAFPGLTSLMPAEINEMLPTSQRCETWGVPERTSPFCLEESYAHEN